MSLSSVLFASSLALTLPPAWAATPANAPPYINGAFQVSTPSQLEFIDQNPSSFLNANITLMANITLPALTNGATSNWVPFGNGTTPFTGTFNGQGYTVSHLMLTDPTNTYVGFFGENTGTVKNLVLQGSVTLTSTTTGQAGGLLVGYNNGGLLDSVLTEGAIQQDGPQLDTTGGLVGWNAHHGAIQNAMSTATVSGETKLLGGLVGTNLTSPLTNVAATGSVSGTSQSILGGLVGAILDSTITNAYASGSVTPTGTNIGGFSGAQSGNTITDSYFDSATTGQTSATGSNSGETLSGVTAETTAALQQASTYTGWNFTSVWSLTAGINNGLPMIDLLIPPVAPNAPTLTTVTPGAQQLTVQWAAPTNEGDIPITGYVITATPTTGTTPSPTTVSASATTATLTQLTAGVPYTVTIQAVNTIGSSVPSNSLTGTPMLLKTVPSAPLSLQGTAGNGQATLQWLPPTDTGNTPLTGSVIEATYGNGANAGAFTQNVPANVYAAVVPNLTNGTAYTFTVNATNSVGASAYSNSVTLTPTAPSVPITPPPYISPYIPTPSPTPLALESITLFGKLYQVWATGINTATNITSSIQPNFVEERSALLAGASPNTPDPSAYLLDVLTGNGVTPAPTITAQETGAWLALYAQLGILPSATSAASTVTLSSALTTLQHAQATPAQIANYLYQCWAYDWTTAQQKAATLG